MATSGNDLDWDALSLDDSEKQQYVVNEEHEEQEFRKIIVHDMKSKNIINHQIHSLQVTFASCENVFKAVYDVLRYFPNLDNPNSDYWKKEVIPNLSVCLKQHVEARKFFYEAFGTINDLRNTMSTAAQVIKQSKGDPSAIETAQTNVREMLNELEASIKKAENLSDSAYKTFGTQVDNISKLIKGEKTVSFNEEHSSNRCELTKLYNMRYDMYAELEDLQAETNRYQCLIDATQPHFDSKKSEISKINEEREQLKMLNEEINKKLQDVPEESNGVSILGLKVHFRSTIWTLEASESKRKYYENVINARLSQIKDSEDSKEAKEKSQRELAEYMEECKKKRDLAKSMLEMKKQDIEKKMPAIEKRIANLLEFEKQLIEHERKTYDDVGLRGDVLVEALKSIRIFSETVGKEASAYEPLKAFLKSIKRMVQIDVQLLLKNDKQSIFIAVNRILDNIKDLSEYYDSVGSLIQQLNETKNLNSIPNAIEYE